MGMMGGMGSEGGVERTVAVEMADGEKISGKILLNDVMVKGSAGQYQIDGKAVKILRFAHAPKEPNEEGDAQAKDVLITSTGREIKGEIVRQNWAVVIDCGTLVLDEAKIRTMTFVPLPEPGREKPKLTPEPGPGALQIHPVSGPGVTALSVTGSEIRRLAAMPSTGSRWSTVELREPFSGRATPILAQGLAVYAIGRHVYAYSSAHDTWDVADLPEPAVGRVIVQAGLASTLIHNHLFRFDGASGKWHDFDLATILTGAEPTPLPGGRAEKSH
jgi:hypothetical protein